MGRHREALRTLVLDLHDAASAEAYCTLAGAVVAPRAAHALGERYGLQPWAALVSSPLTPASGSLPSGQGQKPEKAGQVEREKTVDEELKRELTGILLEVYMSGG